MDATEADHAAVAKLGRVAAIIAPHSGHDLGQKEWHARYPDVPRYAPADAIASLEKGGHGPIHPLSHLKTPEGVAFTEVPGTRSGCTHLVVRRGERPVAYVDELIGNNAELPTNLMFRFLFWVTGSSPGLAVNRVFLWGLTRDRRGVAAATIRTLEGDPIVLFAHGTPLMEPGAARRVQGLLAPWSPVG